MDFVAGMGEDWISRRDGALGLCGESGGDEARIGDEASGEGTDGRYIDDASLNIGSGIMANIFGLV